MSDKHYIERYWRDATPADSIKEPPMKIYKADYCTIFCGQSEVIVYGGESDWIVQYARVTNDADGWRRWFSSRDAAEAKAREIAKQLYRGRFGVNEPVTEEPAKFA